MRHHKVVWSLSLSFLLFLSALGGFAADEGSPTATSVQETSDHERDPEPPVFDPSVPPCDPAMLPGLIREVEESVGAGLPTHGLLEAAPRADICEIIDAVLDLLRCDADEECVSLWAWLRDLVDRILHDAGKVVATVQEQLPEPVPNDIEAVPEAVATLVDEAVPESVPTPEQIAVRMEVPTEDYTVQDLIEQVKETVEQVPEETPATATDLDPHVAASVP